MKQYKVTYKSFDMDDKPTIKIFDQWYEAEQWIQDEKQARIDHTVQHCPYHITEKDLADIEEQEHVLISVETIQQTKGSKL